METHLIPGARFVDPKVLARIKDLDFLAKSVVDGFINGLHRAPYFGASVDFAEHRGYVAGDDIRRVDWRVGIVRVDERNHWTSSQKQTAPDAFVTATIFP